MTDTAPGSQKSSFTQFVARRWFGLVLLALAAVFIAQNRQTVSIDVLWATVSAPLWLVLTITLGVGVLAAVVSTRRRRANAR